MNTLPEVGLELCHVPELKDIPQNFSRLYGFTLKDITSREIFLNEENYQPLLASLRKRGEIKEVYYENLRKDGKSRARLHVHGIIQFDRIPKLTTLCPRGFSTKFEPIYDYRGWLKYCVKNCN